MPGHPIRYIEDPNYPELPADDFNFHAHIINTTIVHLVGDVDKITLPDVAITMLYNIQRSLVDYFIMPKCTSFTFTCEVTHHDGSHCRIRIQRKGYVIRIGTVKSRGTKEWGENDETMVTYRIGSEQKRWHLCSFLLKGKAANPDEMWDLAMGFAKDIYESNIWATDTIITKVMTDYEFGQAAETPL